ncbi:MAG: cob(I)yrinic acid a,c-diamide adenosyltransferase [Gammaproteobacteria bacterium]|nr:cob(I)yrinic acid a,c-diamide adenosyltransferase [Gammaproteobacteria bacterium]
MPRISKVTTKTGDDGTTGLADGSRLSKTDKRIHLLGELDELNAHIGLCISLSNTDQQSALIQIQHDLFDMGGEICQPGKTLINDQHISFLEEEINQKTEQLSLLKEFILPTGSPLVANLHISRTIARRCERSACDMLDELNLKTLQYLNRLSDFLFVYSRFMTQLNKEKEIYWQSQYSRI